MPLDPLQEEVARVALHLAEAGHVALAGGGAMLAHEFIDRPTMDLDLFTSDPGEVGPVTDALHKALRERGYAVEVTRREDTFSHLQVTAPDGRQVDVELAQDARMLPAVQLAVGAVLHPDELAADKTLALFGRGAARDLVESTPWPAGSATPGCSSSRRPKTPGSTPRCSPMRSATRPPGPRRPSPSSASTSRAPPACSSAQRPGEPSSEPALTRTSPATPMPPMTRRSRRNSTRRRP